MPDISVIIPNYNHGSFLEQRIESVLNQTYQDFELIILDDCSPDNSRDIIENYRHHPKVTHVIYNEKNSGNTFMQWNKGIELAKAALIWIAESDDFADPCFLSAVLPSIQADEHIGIAYCQSLKVNDKNEVFGSWKEYTDDLNKSLFASDFSMAGTEFIKNFLVHKNALPNASAVTFRKQYYHQAGSAETDIKNCSDWLTWLKMLSISDVSFIAKPYNYFRYHQNSVIATTVKNLDHELYFEWYNRTMRKRFNAYLKAKYPSMTEIIELNQTYISKEDGDEGIFELERGKWIRGWKKVIKTAKRKKQRVFYFKSAWKLTLTSTKIFIKQFIHSK